MCAAQLREATSALAPHVYDTDRILPDIFRSCNVKEASPVQLLARLDLGSGPSGALERSSCVGCWESSLARRAELEGLRVRAKWDASGQEAERWVVRARWWFEGKERTHARLSALDSRPPTSPSSNTSPTAPEASRTSNSQLSQPVTARSTLTGQPQASGRSSSSNAVPVETGPARIRLPQSEE